MALCRAWTKELGPRSSKLANYFARFRRIVQGEKEPEPKPSELDLMTPAQRQALVDADRARTSRL
jgi:hypothetical protein